MALVWVLAACGDPADMATRPSVEPSPSTAARASTTASPARDHVPVGEVDAPPTLWLRTGKDSFPIEPYDYCWDGVCGDWFDAKEPDVAVVAGDHVELDWHTNAHLVASPRATDGCHAPPALRELTRGRWELAMPPDPGITVIGLLGWAPRGDTSFLIEVTSTTPGPPTGPYVEVAWPTTTEGAEIRLGVIGFEADTAQATFLIQSADGRPSELEVDLGPSDEPGKCSRLLGTMVIDGLSGLGRPPLQVELRLGEFRSQFVWPDHFEGWFDPGRITRSMLPPDGY